MKAITTTYRAATGNRGSRIVATDSDANKIVFDHHNANSHDEAHFLAAQALCQKMNWKGRLAQGSLGPGIEVFVFLGNRNIWTIGD